MTGVGVTYTFVPRGEARRPARIALVGAAPAGLTNRADAAESVKNLLADLPRPGRHTREILGEIGLSPDEIETLLAAGAVWSDLGDNPT